MEEQAGFGEWLRHELGQRNLTISEAARRLGVSQGAVSNWVRGLRRPDADSMRRLAEVLDVSVVRIMEAADVDHSERAAPVNSIRGRIPRRGGEYMQLLNELHRGDESAYESGFFAGVRIGRESAFEQMRSAMTLLLRVPMDDETAKHVHPWLNALWGAFEAEWRTKNHTTKEDARTDGTTWTR